MDINDLRSLITVAAFVMFCAIVAWTFSGRRSADFDAAARMPLEDDQPVPVDTHKGLRS